MCCFGNFFFDHNNNGSFPIQIPAFHFLLSSSSLRSCVHFSQRPLKLRSTVATNSRVTVVIRAAGFPSAQQSDPNNGDSSSEANLQGRGRSQKPSSSSSIAISSSSSSSASAATESSSSLSGGLPPADPSPSSFKQLSHMSKWIKAAFGVFQGWKVIQKLHAPSLEGTLLSGLGGPGNWAISSAKASKFFAKGLKVSQKVLTSCPLSKLIFKGHADGAIIEKLVQNDLASLAKAFNAFYAAIKIAEFSRSFGKHSQDLKLPDANFMWKGYKFSKSLVSILDAVAGKNGWALAYMGKGFLIVKKGLGGIGVMVKAVVLSKELGAVVLKRLAISGGTFAAVLGARHHTSNRNTPMEVSQQSGSNRLICMKILTDLAFASFRNCSLKDESLASLILLFRYFMEDYESVHVEFCEEVDLLTIFCLALPLRTNELPVFA